MRQRLRVALSWEEKWYPIILRVPLVVHIIKNVWSLFQSREDILQIALDQKETDLWTDPMNIWLTYKFIAMLALEVVTMVSIDLILVSLGPLLI